MHCGRSYERSLCCKYGGLRCGGMGGSYCTSNCVVATGYERASCYDCHRCGNSRRTSFKAVSRCPSIEVNSQCNNCQCQPTLRCNTRRCHVLRGESMYSEPNPNFRGCNWRSGVCHSAEAGGCINDQEASDSWYRDHGKHLRAQTTNSRGGVSVSIDVRSADTRSGDARKRKRDYVSNSPPGVLRSPSDCDSCLEEQVCDYGVGSGEVRPVTSLSTSYESDVRQYLGEPTKKSGMTASRSRACRNNPNAGKGSGYPSYPQGEVVTSVAFENPAYKYEGKNKVSRQKRGSRQTSYRSGRSAPAQHHSQARSAPFFKVAGTEAQTFSGSFTPRVVASPRHGNLFHDEQPAARCVSLRTRDGVRVRTRDGNILAPFMAEADGAIRGPDDILYDSEGRRLKVSEVRHKGSGSTAGADLVRRKYVPAKSVVRGHCGDGVHITLTKDGREQRKDLLEDVLSNKESIGTVGSLERNVGALEPIHHKKKSQRRGRGEPLKLGERMTGVAREFSFSSASFFDSGSSDLPGAVYSEVSDAEFFGKPASAMTTLVRQNSPSIVVKNPIIRSRSLVVNGEELNYKDHMRQAKCGPSTEVPSRIYSRAQRLVREAARVAPMLIFAIPKYKRDSTLNVRWSNATIRVHAILHTALPPIGSMNMQHNLLEATNERNICSGNSHWGPAANVSAGNYERCGFWPPASSPFRGRSPHRPTVGTGGVIWETYLDLATHYMGTDPMNSDTIFITSLPSVPTFDKVVESLRYLGDDGIPNETWSALVRGLSETNLNECVFTLRLVPYQSSKDMLDERAWHCDVNHRSPERKFIAGELKLTNGSTNDGKTAVSKWREIPDYIDMDLHNNLAYQVSFPAVRDLSKHATIFSLRDGCMVEGDQVLTSGIVITFSTLHSRDWYNTKPVIKFFDETDGQWKEQVMQELHGRSECFVSVHLTARRLVFVIRSNEKNGEKWIRSVAGPDFIVSFPGTFEVFGNGKIMQICDSASVEALDVFKSDLKSSPASKSQGKEKNELATVPETFSLDEADADLSTTLIGASETDTEGRVSKSHTLIGASETDTEGRVSKS